MLCLVSVPPPRPATCRALSTAMSFFGLPSDPGIIGEHLEAQQSKFPHTRALLSSITRQYKSTDNGDSDAETDDFTRVPTAMVNRVAAMLGSEQEDELKVFLRSSYGIDGETVWQHPTTPHSH